MRSRTRKLIGTILMLLLVLIYFPIAVEISSAWLIEASGPVQLFGYLFAGFAWIVPAGVLIKWMSRPDPPPYPPGA